MAVLDDVLHGSIMLAAGSVKPTLFVGAGSRVVGSGTLGAGDAAARGALDAVTEAWHVDLTVVQFAAICVRRTFDVCSWFLRTQNHMPPALRRLSTRAACLCATVIQLVGCAPPFADEGAASAAFEANLVAKGAGQSASHTTSTTGTGATTTAAPVLAPAVVAPTSSSSKQQNKPPFLTRLRSMFSCAAPRTSTNSRDQKQRMAALRGGGVHERVALREQVTCSSGAWLGSSTLFNRGECRWPSILHDNTNACLLLLLLVVVVVVVVVVLPSPLPVLSGGVLALLL